MTDPTPSRGLPGVLASAAFARAFTLTVFGAVFSSVAIERLTSRVTYATIVVGLCVIAIGMLAARRHEVSLLRLVPTTLVAFVGWAALSVFWSTDQSRSLWAVVSLAAIALLSVTIGHVRDTLQTVRALADVMRVLLSVSLALEVLSGILLDTPLRFLGIQGNIAQLGPVQGIFGTRNLLGFAAILAVVTFLVEYRTQSVRTGVSLYSVVLGGSLAVLSDSPTVLVLAAAVGVATAALMLVRRTTPSRRPALQWTFAGLLVVGIVAGYLANVHCSAGRWDGVAWRTSMRAPVATPTAAASTSTVGESERTARAPPSTTE